MSQFDVKFANGTTQLVEAEDEETAAAKAREIGGGAITGIKAHAKSSPKSGTKTAAKSAKSRKTAGNKAK